jgi:hypothetical protein
MCLANTQVIRLISGPCLEEICISGLFFARIVQNESINKFENGYINRTHEGVGRKFHTGSRILSQES